MNPQLREEREKNIKAQENIFYEVLTTDELAAKWKVHPSWIREQTRCRAVDPLPHIRLGRYIRFQLNAELAAWWKRRQSGSRKYPCV
jgi:hypothetical protein